MREGYKKTEIGVIPEDWEVKKLEDICEFLDGRRKPIKAFDRENIKGDIPYYGASGIIDWINDYIFDEDIILLGEDGENLKSRNVPLAFKVTGKCWVNNHAHVLKPKKDNIDFVTEILESKDYTPYVIGSAQPKLTQAECRKIKIQVPPLKEQEKIAEILSTVDSQIDDTEKLIEKSKELKKGLMQKLLTKGIGHSEFKKTGVGEIPVSWEVKKLSELTNKLTDGSHSSPIPVDDSNYKICTVANMRKNTLDISSATNISKEDYEKLINNGCYAENGDVLLSKDGTIGKTILYSQENEKIVLLSSIAILKPMKEKLRGEYLNQYLQDSRTLTRIVNTKTGSAIKRIVLRDINSLKIVVPKLKEQEKIAKILLSVDNEIEEYENKKQRLEYLKKGLMQQLLTGKIRTII